MSFVASQQNGRCRGAEREAGGPPIPWDIALNLDDYAGFWEAPEDEQGREMVRQYAVLKQHLREQIYNIAGNHDAAPFGAPTEQLRGGVERPKGDAFQRGV